MLDAVYGDAVACGVGLSEARSWTWHDVERVYRGWSLSPPVHWMAQSVAAAFKLYKPKKPQVSPPSQPQSLAADFPDGVVR